MTGPGRTVLRLVAGALCVAALAAIVAILSGDFSEGDLKVIGTSVLFALTTSTGGAGAGLRLRGGDVGIGLGTIVVVASAATFAFVTYGMWVEVDDEVLWRATWTLAIVALDGAHACFVLTRRRLSDPQGAQTATVAAVLAAALSGTMGILAVTGLAEKGPWELLAIVLVVQLLATALAPLLRRLAKEQPSLTTDPFGIAARPDLRSQMRAIADELDEAASPAAVRELAEQLRHLARNARDLES